MVTQNQPSLRRVFLLDAAACTLMGVLLVAASEPLARLTGIPAGLLFYAGALLFPVALLMVTVATKYINSFPLVWFLVVGNGIWVLASVALLVGDWISPNGWGVALIAVQATAVAGLAALEGGLARKRVVSAAAGY